jgi:hypothetical protein
MSSSSFNSAIMTYIVDTADESFLLGSVAGGSLKESLLVILKVSSERLQNLDDSGTVRLSSDQVVTASNSNLPVKFRDLAEVDLAESDKFWKQKIKSEAEGIRDRGKIMAPNVSPYCVRGRDVTPPYSR